MRASLLAPLGLVSVLLLPPLGGCIVVVGDHETTYDSSSSSRPPRMIGVETEPVTGVLAEQTGVDASRSCVISRVIPGSPAEAAGLKRYDILTGADAEPGSISGLRSAVRAKSVGETIHLKFTRGGQPMEVDVAIASRNGAD